MLIFPLVTELLNGKGRIQNKAKCCCRGITILTANVSSFSLLTLMLLEETSGARRAWSDMKT